MEVNRLRAFVAVAEHSHFARAADRLNITQPGLTKRIRALEDQLGCVLFDRDRQPVGLTPLGKLLLPDARRLVSEADRFLVAARRGAAGEIGSLNIGFGLSTIALAPSLIARFRSENPNVHVTMNDFSSQEQVERLRRDDLDLAFLRLPVSSEFDSLALATDRLSLALPPDASRDGEDVPSHELNRLGFIALRTDRGRGLAEQVKNWSRSVNFEPRVIQEVDDIQTVLALVAAGLGCAIVPATSKILLPGRLDLRPIDDPTATWTVGAAWKASRSVGALARLIEVLRESARPAD